MANDGGGNKRAQAGHISCVEVKVESKQMIMVIVLGVYQDSDNRYFVLLQDPQSKLKFTIWIGQCEAWHISHKLGKIETDAKPTFDLIAEMILKLNAQISFVLIDDVDKDFFEAAIYFPGTSFDAINGRPSDGIALALALKIPIYVTEKLLEKHGRKS